MKYILGILALLVSSDYFFGFESDNQGMLTNPKIKTALYVILFVCGLFSFARFRRNKTKKESVIIQEEGTSKTSVHFKVYTILVQQVLLTKKEYIVNSNIQMEEKENGIALFLQLEVNQQKEYSFKKFADELSQEIKEKIKYVTNTDIGYITIHYVSVLKK